MNRNPLFSLRNWWNADIPDMFFIRTLATILFLGIHVFAWTQSNDSRKWIKDLASPELFGRGYVNHGDSLAAEYIAAEMKNLGALPVFNSYFQPFQFGVNTFPDTIEFKMNGKTLIPGVDFIVDPNCPSVNATYKIKFYDPSHWENALMRHSSDEILVFSSKGITDKDSLKRYQEILKSCSEKYPVIRLQNKLTWSVGRRVSDVVKLDMLASSFPENAEMLHVKINNRFIPKYSTRNVWSIVPAKKKSDKYILITAHYDHLGMMGTQACFFGANDNASGIAQLLSLLKGIVKNPLKKFNVIFVAFAGEEAGLLGSSYMADHCPVDLKKIRFLFNLDLQGTGEEGATIVNATLHEKEFKLLTNLNKKTKSLVQIKPRGTAANSDHYPFSQKGVPAFFMYTMGGSKAYHDINDQADQLSLFAFDGVTKLVDAFLRKLK